ncbi:eukaryotic translation initiation factor 3 subunit J [Danaus plexippus]|uniref:Eukaryotic translation initiation factor 3 subunit J n=1 Tax=Danaus plexippus plexippus TaxID=278856 RepID=A0A212F025_DANPL|nr:eukaryotic translation initiation factor 3 subunit J [Danaus plexippus]OWR47106.1 eukaryotic translation initiation factor 3 subunit J [Danaus plexippus plexippus]
MDVSWDADNFEPKLPTTLASNKWEGEDEEETVKDSWEDEEEEKKDEEKKETVPPPPKPKKKILDKIAEKERLERQKSVKQVVEKEELTPEEKLAEKLRQQKLQEESDLLLALETFGVTDGAGKLDCFHPTNKQEFTDFAELLCKKINIYKAKDEFPGFVDELVKNIIVQMSSADIKRIKMTVDNLYIEKQKAEKNEKAKKPNKGKGKAKLKVEGESAHLNQYEAYGTFDDDFDDFM